MITLEQIQEAQSRVNRMIEVFYTQKLRDLADSLDAKKTPLIVFRAMNEAADIIDAQTAEITRLRDGIEEAIRLLGMDRPIDPTDTLRAALAQEGS